MVIWVERCRESAGGALHCPNAEACDIARHDADAVARRLPGYGARLIWASVASATAREKKTSG